MSEGLAVLTARVDGFEHRLTTLEEGAVSKELHTSEYQAIDRRIGTLESMTKAVIMLTLTNLIAAVGFLAWHAISGA